MSKLALRYLNMLNVLMMDVINTTSSYGLNTSFKTIARCLAVVKFGYYISDSNEGNNT